MLGYNLTNNEGLKVNNKHIIKAGIITALTITLFAIGTTKVFADSEYCGSWHKVATAVMESRQKGLSIADMLDVAKQNPSIENEVTAIVAAAYDIPIQASDEAKHSIKIEFANQIFMICYRINLENI